MGLAGSETFSESELEDERRASGGTRPQDTSLLTDEESLAVFQDRWYRLQVRFVEEPGRAAVDAEDLIRDIAAALAASTVRAGPTWHRSALPTSASPRSYGRPCNAAGC